MKCPLWVHSLIYILHLSLSCYMLHHVIIDCAMRLIQLARGRITSMGNGSTKYLNPEIILCMCPANERQHYNVTSSLIGWAHTKNDPWNQFKVYIHRLEQGRHNSSALAMELHLSCINPLIYKQTCSNVSQLILTADNGISNCPSHMYEGLQLWSSLCLQIVTSDSARPSAGTVYTTK